VRCSGVFVALFRGGALTQRALGRALELFVASLAQKAAAVAKSRKSKMLTAAHLCVRRRSAPPM
jgi:histone H3/H4